MTSEKQIRDFKREKVWLDTKNQHRKLLLGGNGGGLLLSLAVFGAYIRIADDLQFSAPGPVPIILLFIVLLFLGGLVIAWVSIETVARLHDTLLEHMHREEVLAGLPTRDLEGNLTAFNSRGERLSPNSLDPYYAGLVDLDEERTISSESLLPLEGKIAVLKHRTRILIGISAAFLGLGASLGLLFLLSLSDHGREWLRPIVEWFHSLTAPSPGAARSS